MSAALAVYRGAGALAERLGLAKLVLARRPDELHERMGNVPNADGPRPLWIHAASLGEMGAARALVREIRALPDPSWIALSATTRAGRERAGSLSPEIGPFFVPLDVPRFVRRARERLRPTGFVLLETEIWPTLLLDLASQGIPWGIASARLSGRSVRRMQFVRGLYASVLSTAGAIAARTEEDARRYIELGAPPQAVRATGDLKESIDVRPYAPAPTGPFRWIAACTRPGEEAIVLEALAHLAREGLRGELWLAPRHAERFEEVDRLVAAAGRPCKRWSQHSATGELMQRDAANLETAPWSVVLVDRLGVLDEAYRDTSCAFVGGSLLPFGGHNPLEAAAAGRPILVGPHTEQTARAVEALTASGAARRVSDAVELAREVATLARSPQEADVRGRAAHAVAARSSGAARDAVAFLRSRGVIRS